MTAEQIRGRSTNLVNDAEFLREIAAQLAELNENIKVLVRLENPAPPKTPRGKMMRIGTMLKRVRSIKKQLLLLREAMNEYDVNTFEDDPQEAIADAANLVINAEKLLMRIEAHRAGRVSKTVAERTMESYIKKIGKKEYRKRKKLVGV